MSATNALKKGYPKYTSVKSICHFVAAQSLAIFKNLAMFARTGAD